MIHLLVSDIDGTLLDKNRVLSRFTINTLKSLNAPIILISARMPQAMEHLQKEIGISGTPMICYNGALVVHKEKIICDIQIKTDVTREIMKLAQDSELHLSSYSYQDWWVPELDFWAQREENNTKVIPEKQSYKRTLDFLEQKERGVHKLMLMGDPTRMEQALKSIERSDQLRTNVQVYRSKDTYAEITPLNTSKDRALRKLLASNYPNITMQEVVAFGDNYNDINLLKEVGYGVAVDNARDEAKLVANYHTDHHKEDGVANWITLNSNLFSKIQ